MQTADDVNRLEFLNLKITCLNGKLSVDVYSKPTNSFIYLCYAINVLSSEKHQ